MNSPHKGPVMMFVDPHNLLNKQLNDWWFETTWYPRDIIAMFPWNFNFKQQIVSEWDKITAWLNIIQMVQTWASLLWEDWPVSNMIRNQWVAGIVAMYAFNRTYFGMTVFHDWWSRTIIITADILLPIFSYYLSQDHLWIIQSLCIKICPQSPYDSMHD